MEGSTVLAAGSAVRIRPLDGGGNESQLNSPSAGVLSVHGLAPGNYEAVDEVGNRRVFTVTSASDEIVLEDYGQGPDVPADVPLDPLHPTEAPLVADQSHEIQAGQPAMTVEGSTLVRGELDASVETAPPTIPGPNPPAAEPPVAPSAVVTDETVGNSSDAQAPTPEGATQPPAAPSNPAGEQRQAFDLTTPELVAVVSGDTASFPQAGSYDVGASVDELKRRAEGGDVDAQAGLEQHGLVQPAQPTEPSALDAKSLAAVVAGADDAPAGVEPVAARDELERRAKDGDPEAEQALASLAGSEVPPADDPEHVSETPAVDPGAQA